MNSTLHVESGNKEKCFQVEDEDKHGALQVRRVVCPHHVVIKCSPQLKGKLLAKKKQFAGQIDPQGYKYFIAQYLPEPFKAAQNKHRAEVSRILLQNSKKKDDERKTTVRVIGTELQIDNKNHPIIHTTTYTGRRHQAQKRIQLGDELF